MKLILCDYCKEKYFLYSKNKKYCDECKIKKRKLNYKKYYNKNKEYFKNKCRKWEDNNLEKRKKINLKSFIKNKEIIYTKNEIKRYTDINYKLWQYNYNKKNKQIKKEKMKIYNKEYIKKNKKFLKLSARIYGLTKIHIPIQELRNNINKYTQLIENDN